MLRLVSKAWRAAAATCEGMIYLEIQQAADIGDVCKSLPGLSELDVLSQGISFDISTLQQRNGLTGLCLTNKTETDYVEACAHVKLLVDLRLLPFSLRSLDMSGFCMKPATYHGLMCTRLTSLTFRWLSNSPTDICQLLHLLPHLRDANLGPAQMWSYDLPGEDLSPTMRNHTLERLQLNDGPLLFSNAINSAPALKFLTLRSVSVSKSWLQGLSSALPCLEELSFEHCSTLDEVDEASITPSRTLRHLEIDQYFDGFVTIAGAALQSLQFYPWPNSPPRRIAAISRLSGLTELELGDIECSAGFRALRSMPLQILGLHNCPGTEFLLFVPGAFTALRELYFSEENKDVKDFAKKLRSDADSPPAVQQEMKIFLQQLRDVGKVVLSMPNLVKLSGHSKLLRYGIRDGQNGWKKTANGCGSVEECFCYKCADWQCDKYA